MCLLMRGDLVDWCLIPAWKMENMSSGLARGSGCRANAGQLLPCHEFSGPTRPKCFRGANYEPLETKKRLASKELSKRASWRGKQTIAERSWGAA